MPALEVTLARCIGLLSAALSPFCLFAPLCMFVFLAIASLRLFPGGVVESVGA